MKPLFENIQLQSCQATPLPPTHESNQPQDICLSENESSQSGILPVEQAISADLPFNMGIKNFTAGQETDSCLKAEQEHIGRQIDLFLSACREDGIITMSGLQKLAHNIGVKNDELLESTVGLIRLIQIANNQQPCFRINPGMSCNRQIECRWGVECQKLIAEYWR